MKTNRGTIIAAENNKGEYEITVRFDVLHGLVDNGLLTIGSTVHIGSQCPACSVKTPGAVIPVDHKGRCMTCLADVRGRDTVDPYTAVVRRNLGLCLCGSPLRDTGAGVTCQSEK